jgi:hypothetical protein
LRYEVLRSGIWKVLYGISFFIMKKQASTVSKLATSFGIHGIYKALTYSRW